MVRTSNRLLVVAASILLAISLYFIFSWIHFLFTPLVTAEKGVSYTVPSGASLRSVVKDLHLLDVIKRPFFFDLLVYLKGSRRDLKAGDYLFPKGTTPLRLLSQITTGNGMIYYSFTIIDGWNLDRKSTRLNSSHSTLSRMPSSA